MNKNLPQFSGMSLMEILVTVFIITLLCSIAVYSYQEYKTKTLYSNSMSIMEQNKSIIYSYFSKFKECPNTQIVNKRLDNYHIGDSIINSGCDIILCQGTQEILSLNATINNEIVTALSDGIQYRCNFVNSTDFGNIPNFLPQCTISNNVSNRCN